MIAQLYAIYDLKTQVFYPPMVAANDEHVARQVRSVLRRGGEFAEFPGDYQLFRIGVWNDASAAIESVSPPVLVLRLDQLLEREAEGPRVSFPDRTAPPTEMGGGGRRP